MEALLRRLWGYTLEIFFPPICIRCRTYLLSREEREDLLCNECFGSIPIYKTVSWSPKFTLAAVSSYDNEAIKELIHALKYKKFLATRSPLEKLIMTYIKTVDLKKIVPEDALLIPIPLHRKRFRERGFNQAEVIAEILGKYLNLPVKHGLLLKTIDTPHQTLLRNKKERKESVKDSFEINRSAKLKDKNVILVDDIYTSGATINEAVRVLKKAGIKVALGFVIAKTQ